LSGWSHQISISYSEKLVVADNLYRINFSTGETFQYPLRTGQPDAGGNIVKSLIALTATTMLFTIASGLSSYYFYYYVPMVSGFVGMSSNKCQNDSVYYIADRDRIY
jgi:amino acid transporter